jgi:ribonucleoside-triphosphate reductase
MSATCSKEGANVHELTQIEDEIAKTEIFLAHPEDLGIETEVYARVSGYYRSVKNWNEGKISEMNDRKAYIIA